MIARSRWYGGALALSLVLSASTAAEDAAKAPALMQGFPPPAEAQVTFSNWVLPPYSRWAFKHVESLLPSRPIYRGSGPVVPLPTASKKVVARYEAAMGEGGNFDLGAYIRDNYVDAIVVLKDGKLVAEHYGDGQTAETRHIMYSVTKSVGGTLAEMLIAEGKLDDTKLVTDYVPELKDSGYGDATVRQVLDMLVALDFTETYGDPYSSISQFAYSAGLAPAPEGVKVYPSMYDYLPTISKQGNHGEAWRYISATTEVLAWIMSRASGQSWGELFEQRIYSKLGADRDASVIVDPHGIAFAAGGMSITARDGARFAQMIANDGKFNGQQVVPAKVVKKIKQGGDPTKFKSQRPGGEQRSYFSQWYLDPEISQLGAWGIHGQAFQIDMEGGIVIVTQSSWPVAGTTELWDRRAAFERAVHKALAD
ncbi:serine hydrolase domain-containing protein [Gimibacter soli]|uniref:Serine hydrolase n=1 Tax=Gimibacter soli TaxID=3024400 RepID=A0AAE9XLS9_9PROT|nr:serine hydrolase [Gimibacter soli]WCL53243.1 serine hydrolase [Gimibacter soli]